MKARKQPKLKEIDLSKCTAKEGGYHDHPDIQTRKKYLAKIGGDFFTGTFSREWYGLTFEDGWGGSGHQLDKPGTNASTWQRLWEIIP
jgi:hypothetical protein